MYKSSRTGALRALLLAAATASSLGCGDSGDGNPNPSDAGGGGSGGSAKGGSGGESAAGGVASGSSGQGGSNVSTCVPGTVQACPCAGSDKNGVQTCQANGTYGSCTSCPSGSGGKGGSSAGGSSGQGGSGGTGGAGGSGGSGQSGQGGSGGSSAGQGGQGGASGAGAGGAGGSGATGGTGGAGFAFECKDPKPHVVNGVDTGYAQCASGAYVRRENKACPVPAINSTCSDPSSTCKSPDDCAQFPGTYCQPFSEGSNLCGCMTAFDPCVHDTACSSGNICVCLSDGARCLSGFCSSSADCAVGDCMQVSCRMDAGSLLFGGEFRCQTAQDTCAVATDCPDDQDCLFVNGHRSCGAKCMGPVEMGVPGRPLHVEASRRLAALTKHAEAWG